MYLDGQIFLRPHESVVSATSSEATAKIYKFYSVASYIVNQNEFDEEIARVSSQLTDEEQANDPAYCTQLILQDDQFKVIWGICSIKMMRCKFCKLYYKYQISSGRAHVAPLSQHEIHLGAHDARIFSSCATHPQLFVLLCSLYIHHIDVLKRISF